MKVKLVVFLLLFAVVQTSHSYPYKKRYDDDYGSDRVTQYMPSICCLGIICWPLRIMI